MTATDPLLEPLDDYDSIWEDILSQVTALDASGMFYHLKTAAKKFGDRPTGIVELLLMWESGDTANAIKGMVDLYKWHHQLPYRGYLMIEWLAETSKSQAIKDMFNEARGSGKRVERVTSTSSSQSQT